MKKIDKLNFRPFTRFCMSIGAVPSSYLAGLTIEEQLLWLCSYLEKEVIPAVNNNGEAVTELQNLYVELHDYVEHYFDNLDVQDEINNKLDEMVEDGTLTDIIAQYITEDVMRIFETVEDMVEADLTEGMTVKTLGYYQPNDGGGATYNIVESTMNYAETLDNTLLAELLIENNEVNALQIGIKRNDNTYDSHDKILNFVTNYNYCLFFPKGTYYLSETFFNKNCHVNLKGETTCYNIQGTIFKPYGNNNGYIIKCGGKANYTVDSTSDYTINQLSNISIDGITFSDFDNPVSLVKYSYSCCLAIDNCSNVKLNVKFYYCNTNGLLLRETWELQSDWISCRAMYGNFNTCGILIASRSMSTSGSGTNALFFNLLDFEQINGRCLTTETDANCSNIAINTITIENARGNIADLRSKKVATVVTGEVNTFRASYHFNPLLSFDGQSIAISKLDCGALCNGYYYMDGDSTQGKWYDVILELMGNVNISAIAIPSLFTAILTKPRGDTYAISSIGTITSTGDESQTTMPRKNSKIYLYR